MVSDQRAPYLSKDVMRAWRTAERQALARIGFRRDDTDEYACTLNEAGDWTGRLMLFKRPAGRGFATVRLDPVGLQPYA